MAAADIERFDRFMRRALHDPRTGYYARRIRRLGRGGDFTTAPMLTDALGRAVARWAARSLRECGCRDLIEIGPGEGLLARSVRRHLPFPLRWRVRLHLVENSAPLAAIQRETLGRSVLWHGTPREALAACRGQAVIFSNELVDAFPVRRFRMTADGWREIGVSFGGDNPREVLLPAGPLPESSSLRESHPLGQRVEVHESYRHWLEDWLPEWLGGAMLTIDYGSTADSLYHRRPDGTLRGYRMHQRVHGLAIYDSPGHQDLTADVNFTDLRQWSDPWMAEQRLRCLAAFLAEETPCPPASGRGSFPVAESLAGPGGLWDPDGAGGAFQALEQRRKP